MTLARRICALMEIDGEGRLKGVPTSVAGRTLRTHTYNRYAMKCY